MLFIESSIWLWVTWNVNDSKNLSVVVEETAVTMLHESEMMSKLYGISLHSTKYKTCLSSSVQILSNSFWFSSSSSFFDSSRPLISPWQISNYTHAKELGSVCVLTRLLITTNTKSEQLTIIGRGWAKLSDLSEASRSIICLSLWLRQIIDLQDTDKSPYFAITEFNNCFYYHSITKFVFIF